MMQKEQMTELIFYDKLNELLVQRLDWSGLKVAWDFFSQARTVTLKVCFLHAESNMYVHIT